MAKFFSAWHFVHHMLFILLPTTLAHYHCEDSEGAVKHVLLIGVDGLSGVYLEHGMKEHDLPHINRLIATGGSTFYGRSVLPSDSSPGWSAMLTGQGPLETGVLHNGFVSPYIKSDFVDSNGRALSVFELAKRGNPSLLTAYSVSYSGITDIIPSAFADLTFSTNTEDQKVTDAMVRFISNASYRAPDLMFLHLDEVDAEGHANIWGSNAYFSALKRTDIRIGSVLSALDARGIRNETAIIFTSDHGGHCTGHGGPRLMEILVPMIFNGPCFPKGKNLNRAILTSDITPTILHLLGLEKERHYAHLRSEVAECVLNETNSPVNASVCYAAYTVVEPMLAIPSRIECVVEEYEQFIAALALFIIILAICFSSLCIAFACYNWWPQSIGIGEKRKTKSKAQ